MKFNTFFRVSSYAMVACGALALAVSGGLSAVLTHQQLEWRVAVALAPAIAGWGISCLAQKERKELAQIGTLMLAAQGCNHTRVWMCNWSLGIESDVADQYRFDRAAELDEVLVAARAKGIRIMLVLDNHTDLVDGKHFPYGDGLEARQKAADLSRMG